MRSSNALAALRFVLRQEIPEVRLKCACAVATHGGKHLVGAPECSQDGANIPRSRWLPRVTICGPIGRFRLDEPERDLVPESKRPLLPEEVFEREARTERPSAHVYPHRQLPLRGTSAHCPGGRRIHRTSACKSPYGPAPARQSFDPFTATSRQTMMRVPFRRPRPPEDPGRSATARQRRPPQRGVGRRRRRSPRQRSLRSSREVDSDEASLGVEVVLPGLIDDTDVSFSRRHPIG